MPATNARRTPEGAVNAVDDNRGQPLEDPGIGTMQSEPGSFRDRGARVFYRNGAVLRGLNARARDDWRRVCETGLVAKLVGAGQMVDTEEVGETIEPWAAVLRHESIRFVSYPYEWCFEMLQDAALLQLDVLLAALDASCTLQDASPFNVQFRGVRPVFIDVASLKPLAPGEPWVGYRQFCKLFLNPLFLQAYKGLPFQPWLRGSLDGIRPQDCWRSMSVRDAFRRGVFTHVYLHARAQERLAATRRDLRSELRGAGFAKTMIQHNAKRLRRLVSKLAWRVEESSWSHYSEQHDYSVVAETGKIDFVREVASSRHWPLVWDLGCNTGAYARVVAPHAGYTVAMDGDQLAVSRLYRGLREEGIDNVLPLVVDLADPTPNLGWRGRERKALPDRGRPSLILCLALLHHMVIANNVPLPEFVGWLAELGGALIIEFVTRDDPMVQRLLQNRLDQYSDYDVPTFEDSLRRDFTIVRQRSICHGTRHLYYAIPHRSKLDPVV